MRVNPSWGKLRICGRKGEIKSIFLGFGEPVFLDFHVLNVKKGTAENYVHREGYNHRFVRAA
jgi:hypothetical protein